jgi:hypothetical protein
MFEAYIAPRGPLNMFSYFPQGSLIPDLGTSSVTVAVLLSLFVSLFSRTKTLYIGGQFHSH